MVLLKNCVNPDQKLAIWDRIGGYDMVKSSRQNAEQNDNDQNADWEVLTFFKIFISNGSYIGSGWNYDNFQLPHPTKSFSVGWVCVGGGCWRRYEMGQWMCNNSLGVKCTCGFVHWSFVVLSPSLCKYVECTPTYWFAGTGAITSLSHTLSVH